MTFEPKPEVLEAVARAIYKDLCRIGDADMKYVWDRDDNFGTTLDGSFKIKDLAKAAIAAYEATQWQPIETAPKDGAWVLLWCGWCIEGRWFEKGERVQNQWSDDGMGVNPIFHVTHWRSLPPPPA